MNKVNIKIVNIGDELGGDESDMAFSLFGEDGYGDDSTSL